MKTSLKHRLFFLFFFFRFSLVSKQTFFRLSLVSKQTVLKTKIIDKLIITASRIEIIT